MRHILYCKACKKYSLSQDCSCGNVAVENKPPKYSPEDKYAKYRRQAKESKRRSAGKI